MVFNKDKRAGVIGTILFHLLLLLAFMFLGLAYQYPPPEQGILINFGTSDEGMGEIQPEESGEAFPVEKEENVSETPQTEASEVKEEVLTQEKVETIAVPKSEKTAKAQRATAEKKKIEEEQPKMSEEAEATLKKAASIFKNKKKTGEGETGTPGDQGNPNGSKEAISHTGGYGGDGFSFNLKGRKMVSKPIVKEKSQDEGKVVVDLVVDREGNVIRAKAGARGTTYTQNPALWKKLEEESIKIKFSSSDNPYTPEEQRGTVTYVFVLE